MSIIIIKYNAGNIFSVQSAMKRLNIDAIVTDDKELINRAEKIIFPGVGEAASTMNYLRETGLDNTIKNLKQPVLGVCIGMQLLCAHSEEGNVDCLNIFDVPVKKFIANNQEHKIPHMGWNTINHIKEPLFDKSMEDEYVYFVHSYYVPVNQYTIATTDYINPFSAALHKDNFYATQFHTEKSGSIGDSILKQFLKL